MIIQEHNVETGEVIEREATKAELDQFAKDIKAAEARKVAQAEAEVKRQELLDRLGITADEAKLLLG
jgi:hypothetical protein